ncbi:unnamed protein product [Closterium sp. Naga37s-1]|nr:unnamed protein product [Closterium sp. Naga37s-1]
MLRLAWCSTADAAASARLAAAAAAAVARQPYKRPFTMNVNVPSRTMISSVPLSASPSASPSAITARSCTRPRYREPLSSANVARASAGRVIQSQSLRFLPASVSSSVAPPCCAYYTQANFPNAYAHPPINSHSAASHSLLSPSPGSLLHDPRSYFPFVSPSHSRRHTGGPRAERGGEPRGWGDDRRRGRAEDRRGWGESRGFAREGEHAWGDDPRSRQEPSEIFQRRGSAGGGSRAPPPFREEASRPVSEIDFDERGVGRGSHSFFATCAPGLEAVVAEELQSRLIGAWDVVPGKAGVAFQGSTETAYRVQGSLTHLLNLFPLPRSPFSPLSSPSPPPPLLPCFPSPLYPFPPALPSPAACIARRANLWLRCAVRVLHEVAACDLRARYGRADGDSLYRFMRAAADWPSLLAGPGEIGEGEAREDGRRGAAAGRAVGGGNVFRRKPVTFSVQSRVWDCPDIRTSQLASTRAKDAICDAMRDAYNGGTLLIEAALMACRIAPGSFRSSSQHPSPSSFPSSSSSYSSSSAAFSWPFHTWHDFDAATWRAVIREAESLRRTPPAGVSFHGNDIHEGALALCQRDADRAGVGRWIRLSQGDCEEYVPAVAPSLVVVNPPWGTRLGETSGEEGQWLADTWHRLGVFLRRQCRGAEAFVLSGNAAVTQKLFLKMSQRWAVTVGGIECRVLRYVMLPPPAPAAAAPPAPAAAAAAAVKEEREGEMGMELKDAERTG